MRVYLVRDKDDHVVEGIFWANSSHELRDLLNVSDDPNFYEFCLLTGPAGIISLTNADPDAMLRIAPEGGAPHSLSQYGATAALIKQLGSPVLDWIAFTDLVERPN